MGVALRTSAGEDLTDWTFLMVVAMADPSVVDCISHAGPSDCLLGRALSVLTTARQEWFLWPYCSSGNEVSTHFVFESRPRAGKSRFGIFATIGWVMEHRQ
jgi:hypothetical protein